MLVDVVKLREEGNKRSPEVLRRAERIRGHLEVRTSPATGDTEAGLTDTPNDPKRPLSNRLIAYLVDARVTHLRGDQLLVVGTEIVGGSRASGRSYRQAWRCWLVRSR